MIIKLWKKTLEQQTQELMGQDEQKERYEAWAPILREELKILGKTLM